MVSKIQSTTTVSLIAQNASATYVTGTNLSATVPGTWAVGNTVSFKLIYQAA